MAMPKGSSELEGPPNRRRPRESPRGSSRKGNGEGFGPSRDPKRGSSKRLRPWRRASGRVARPLGGASIRKGISGGFGLAGFPGRRDGFGPASFERATGGASASMRAQETARLRPGSIRQGSGGGISVLPKRPDGNRRGASRPSRDPPGAERGFTALLRDPRKAKRAFAPASQSKAAQREMASPPSDGSQSWDKWGPVATPAPIMIPGRCAFGLSCISRLFFRSGDLIIFEERHEGTRQKGSGGLPCARFTVVADFRPLAEGLPFLVPSCLLSKMGSH